MRRGSLRLVLDGPARGKTKGKSWVVGSAWPTVNSVPEPVGRAKGGFGLGSRTGYKDR